MKAFIPARTLGLVGLMAMLAVVASFGVITTSGQVHADEKEVDTSASVESNNAPPIIECKWELPDVDSGLANVQYGDDDQPNVEPVDPNGTGLFPCNRGVDPANEDRPFQADNVQNVIQVQPNPEDEPEARKIQNWLAVEHPNGVSQIDDVFWKVYHADGSFKLQVHGTKVSLEDLDSLGNGGVDDPVLDSESMWEAAYETGQVELDAINHKDFGIVDLVRQGQKALYYADWEISKDQMCGLYTIEAYAVSGAAIAVQTNTLEIECFINLEIDFSEVNWGPLSPGGHKELNGDTNFDEAGNSPYPTVKNTGNSGMQVGVEFSYLIQQTNEQGTPVDGGKTITQFDAAFGKNASVLHRIGYPEDPNGPIPGFDPRQYLSDFNQQQGIQNPDYQTPGSNTAWFYGDSINQVLCANEVGKLDLSVYPPSIVPGGSYTGDVYVYGAWAPTVCANDIAAGIQPPTS